MNIIVLGGSPKGAVSVTMQYVNYLKAQHSEHTFTEHYVAKEIHALEKDPALFQAVMDYVKNADAVLWAFPLYFGLVHSGYKRFIELIFEKDNTSAFFGKHCAILATSIHFLDSTAIEYMRGICEDFGMRVDEVFSASMDDLLSDNGRKQCNLYFGEWCKKIEADVISPRITSPIKRQNLPLKFELPKSNKQYSAKLGIVTESGVSQNLDNMVTAFAGQFSSVEIHDISQIKIAGNCLGCLKCGYENKCVYEGKDDIIDVYRSLKYCDIIVFAGTIKDRYLSARWKTFIDRMFFTTHIPLFTKKSIGFLISGPLRQVSNLRYLLTGLFETDELNVAGFATDEDEDAGKQLDGLAFTLENWHVSGYIQPRQFLGISGHNIFRDAIWSGLKGVFAADHKYYSKHGLYDFPHKEHGKRFISSAMNFAMKLPFIRKEVQKNMQSYMVKPYEKTYK